MPLELLKEFYAIGRSEDFVALDKIPASVVRDYSYIMREAPGVWYEIAECINTKDIVALMKALTIAERVLPGWGAGSVSPVIWLGMVLVQRRYKDLDGLSEWVKANSDNEWLTKRW